MSELEVKELREKLGLTQELFAELLGVHWRTIQNWEKGTPIPKVKDTKLCEIAKKNNILLGDQNALLGDNINGDKVIKEVRKVEVDEEIIEPAKDSAQLADRFLTLLEQKQKSLDELIAQQGRYLSIIENLTNTPTKK